MSDFYEMVSTDSHGEYDAEHCAISTLQSGRFVSISSAEHGTVLMTLPCAEKVYDSLGKALAAAKHVRDAK